MQPYRVKKKNNRPKYLFEQINQVINVQCNMSLISLWHTSSINSNVRFLPIIHLNEDVHGQTRPGHFNPSSPFLEVTGREVQKVWSQLPLGIM